MSNSPYKNREIDSKHEEIIASMQNLRQQMENGFESTYKRQDTTNGRVRWLEKMIWLAMGGLSVLSLEQFAGLVSSFLS